MKLKVAGMVIGLQIPPDFPLGYLELFTIAREGHLVKAKSKGDATDASEDISIGLDHHDERNRPSPWQARGSEKIGLPLDRPAAQRGHDSVRAQIGPHSVLREGGINCYLLSPGEYVPYFTYNDDYSRFTIFLNTQEQENRVADFSSVLRRIFLMVVTARGGVWLHSSAIGFRGDAICFSAPSGVGKTTHTNLWREVYNGVEVLNGDMAYLFPREGKIYFYSAPWAGTSGENQNVIAPVKALVFLEQGKENRIRKLEMAEAFMRLAARCFLPAWDKELELKAFDTAEILAGQVDSYHLECLPNTDAARTCCHGIYI